MENKQPRLGKAAPGLPAASMGPDPRAEDVGAKAARLAGKRYREPLGALPEDMHGTTLGCSKCKKGPSGCSYCRTKAGLEKHPDGHWDWKEQPVQPQPGWRSRLAKKPAARSSHE